MPRTLQEILDNQDRIAAQFEAMEPNGDGLDGEAHRELLAAAHGRGEAEQRVAHAVANARRADYSWALIGQALGTTAQAVQQRYGPRSPSKSRPAADRADSGKKTCEVFHATDSKGWIVRGDLVAVRGKANNLVFQTKAAAVDRARELARNGGGYLIIHKADGTVQSQKDFTRAS